MDADQLSKLEKISRVAKIFLPILHINRIFLTVIGIIFFSFTIASPTSETAANNLFLKYLKGESNINLGMISDGVLTLTDKCMVVFVTVLLYLLVMLGLNALVKLFRCFKVQEVFSHTTSLQVKRIAAIYSIYFLVFKFSPQVITLGWLGWRDLSVSLVFSSYFLLGIVWLGVWIMQVGEALYSENKMTI